MKKSFLLVPFIILTLLFSCITSAHAYIQSDADINTNLQKLYMLKDFDTLTLINKAELIGYRLDNFNQARATYNTAISAAIDQLSLIQSNLQKIETNSSLTNDAKMIQKQKLYEDANSIIVNLSNQSNYFIQAVRDPMPTITYERFCKKFWEFYNSLGL